MELWYLAIKRTPLLSSLEDVAYSPRVTRTWGRMWETWGWRELVKS